MCLVDSARGTQNAPHGTRFRDAVGTRSYLQFWGLCKCNLHFRRMKFALEWLSKWLVGSYLHVQHLWHCKLEVFERIGGLHTHSIHVHIACSMFGFWENAIWMFVRSRLRTHRPNEPNAPQEATKIMYIYCTWASYVFSERGTYQTCDSIALKMRLVMLCCERSPQNVTWS